MENIFYWIWLSILSLKPIEKIKLLNFFNTPEKIFNTKEIDLKKLTDSDKIIKIITNKNKKIEAEKILKEAIQEKISLISYNNNFYSRELQKIYDYPILLYAKGNIDLLNSKCISIVGCRDCSEYGKEVAEKFSFLLSKKDYTIVSGLARGIDTYAHKGSVLATGKTIAVLGSGVNYIYPSENKSTYKEILRKNGLIISEYGINTRPIPEYFPQRNRIISGLSKKVLIVEATRNSGSIITANLACEQGKSIYAIPGNITSSKSSGTNELIKDGAILTTSLEDILYL